MDDFKFSVSGYTGFEDEILTIRNANRSIAQSRDYLDWRYATYLDGPAPVVFWVKSALGETVGMASLIYRPYWVNNKQINLGVIGDISLDSSLRGKGLGQGLLLFIKQHLEQNLPGHAAFVIPNEAAQKGFRAAEWVFGGELVPYVLPINPSEKLGSVFKSKVLAKLVTVPITGLFYLVARLHIKNGYEMQFVKKLDSSFETLWNSISKKNMILCDRGVRYLTWRYLEHPQGTFNIVKFMNGSKLAGYVIFKCSASDKTCLIYDLLVKDKKDLLCMLSLFILNSKKHDNFSTIRLTLSKNHPYRDDLRKMGFIKRKADATFYVLWPDEGDKIDLLNWFISSGDKDI